MNEKVNKKLYVYVGYRDFYINHRKVMNSVNYNQLKGNIVSESDAKSLCDDYYLNKHGMKYQPDKFKDLDPEGTMLPCGLFPLLYQKRNLKRRNLIIQTVKRRL